MHQVILSQVSEMFHSMFQDARMNLKSELDLRHEDPLAVTAMLRYAYMHRLPDLEVCGTSLLELANRFQIYRLVGIVEDYLTTTLQVCNAIHRYERVKRFGTVMALARVERFIRLHQNELRYKPEIGMLYRGQRNIYNTLAPLLWSA